MTFVEVSNELEKLLAMVTDERMQEHKTDGEIFQAVRLKLLHEIRESCWRVESKVNQFEIELKAILKIVEIRETIDRLLRDALGNH